jgi:hypothetical protein
MLVKLTRILETWFVRKLAAAGAGAGEYSAVTISVSPGSNGGTFENMCIF